MPDPSLAVTPQDLEIFLTPEKSASRTSDQKKLHKGSFASIGPGTGPVETVKVIRPNHVSGLSRINVLQCRKRCTGQQKGSPFCPFRETIRKSASFSLCRGGPDVRRHHHQKQKQ